MKLTKLLLPVITFIVIITSCGKDDFTPLNGELTAKPSMLAIKPGDTVNPGDNNDTNNSDKTKLNVPVVIATPTGTTVVVSWEAIPNAVEYHVVFEGTGAPSSQKVTTTSVTVSGVTAGNYTVKVRALAENSNTSIYIDSPFSASVSFSVGSVPAGEEVVKTKLSTPVVSATGVSYNSGQGSTTVSWANVTNANSYSVTLNGQAHSTNSSPFSLNDLDPGTYTVAVTALKGDANHLDSDPGTAVISVKARRPITTPVVSGNVTYTSATAGSVLVTPLFIWPPNNKLTTVTFVGTGTISTGTGTINASHNTDAHATSYVITPSSLSNLAPGDYTVSATAIAGGTYNDDNWVNSSAGSSTFNVAAGSLAFKLVDEYGVYTKDYTLSSNFTLPLQLMASRLGTDMNGRDYTFTITAKNGAGVPVRTTAVSNVPHDQRK